MKKLLSLIIVLFTGMVFGQTDITDKFTDAKFKAEVYQKIKKTAPEAIYDSDVNTIISLKLPSRNIASLAGIEYFVELRQLECEYNRLTSLDVSNNTALTSLDCYINQLTSLNVSNNTALTSLDCHNNQLTSLNVSNNTELTSLDCSNNQLTSLDVSNNIKLKILSCYNNQLTSLNISNNTELVNLYCSNNQLTSLDVSNNIKLKRLSCYNNQLTSLNVSNNTELVSLDVENNYLSGEDKIIGLNKSLLEYFYFDPQKIPIPTSICKIKKSDNNFGIRLSSNIVSDKADMQIILPNSEKVSQAKIVIYDNVGNIVFEKTEIGNQIVWNLTNPAGRSVANGTYLIIAEIRSMNGKTYMYSTKVGVKR
jgi:hypothetical protein